MKLITNYFPKPQPTEQDGQSQPAQQHVEQPQLPAEGQGSPQPEHHDVQPQPAQPQDSRGGQGQSSPPNGQSGQGSHQPEQNIQLPSQPLPKGIENLKTKRYISEKVDCPRCGAPGKVYVVKRGKREYVYIKHRDRDCYLGPARGYFVVQKVLGHLSLTGLNDVNYAEVVASAAEKLMEQIEKAMKENDKRRIEEIIDAMTDIAYVIRDACYATGEKKSHCLEKIAKALFS